MCKMLRLLPGGACVQIENVCIYYTLFWLSQGQGGLTAKSWKHKTALFHFFDAGIILIQKT
jgi:hypothetical protein